MFYSEMNLNAILALFEKNFQDKYFSVHRQQILIYLFEVSHVFTHRSSNVELLLQTSV